MWIEWKSMTLRIRLEGERTIPLTRVPGIVDRPPTPAQADRETDRDTTQKNIPNESCSVPDRQIRSTRRAAQSAQQGIILSRIARAVPARTAPFLWNAVGMVEVPAGSLHNPGHSRAQLLRTVHTNVSSIYCTCGTLD